MRTIVDILASVPADDDRGGRHLRAAASHPFVVLTSPHWAVARPARARVRGKARATKALHSTLMFPAR